VNTGDSQVLPHGSLLYVHVLIYVVQALFLPEASDYISSSPEEGAALCQPVTTSPFVLGLQKIAKERCLPINVGIHEPTDPPSDQLRNTLIWINSDGVIDHRYQKLHMFDVDLRPDGPLMQESKTSQPGRELGTPYRGVPGLGKIASQICFDMRFPDPAIALQRLGANITIYPSAFMVETGKLHWEVLLRARAIETQSWVLAAAQCGRHNSKRVSYGDSIAIDPNGRVIGRLPKVDQSELEEVAVREPELLVVDVDLDQVKSMRKSIPMKRRTDVYTQL
jgi:deaminated glutathione amidase